MTTETPTAAELCKDIDLDEAATALLRDAYGPREFVDALVEAALYLDAIKVLAQALPKRYAIEWACTTIRPEMDETANETELACLAAAEEWVVEPVESNRLVAKAAAEATEFDTASAWTAMGVAWAGGSLAPPDVPVIPPPEHLTGVAVAGALGIAAARVPEEAADRQLAVVKSGLELSERSAPVAVAGVDSPGKPVAEDANTGGLR